MYAESRVPMVNQICLPVQTLDANAIMQKEIEWIEGYDFRLNFKQSQNIMKFPKKIVQLVWLFSPAHLDASSLVIGFRTGRPQQQSSQLRSFLHVIKAAHWIFFHRVPSYQGIGIGVYQPVWVSWTPQEDKKQDSLWNPHSRILDLNIDTMLRPCVLTSQCVYLNSFQITSRNMGVKLGSLEVKPTRRLPWLSSPYFCGFLDVVNQQSGFKPQKVAHGSNCTHHLLNIRHNSSIQRRSSLTRMIEDGRMLTPSTLHVVQSQNLDRCTWCKWICYNIQYNCILNCISYWYESS